VKNVVIHKVVTFIFTEEQLKAYWERKKVNVPFSSLTDEQYMQLAEEMLSQTSHSQLQQHLIGQGWRTEEEATGLVLAEDDSRVHMHVEIVDTSIPANPLQPLFIDRVTEIICPHCSFSFYLRHDVKRPSWMCPSCGNSIDGSR